MIAGQAPETAWRANPGALLRTLDEAIEIAKKWGASIPEDVHFSVDEIGDLGADLLARGPRVDKPTGAFVTWLDLVHHRTGKVPFRIWGGILGSDEAIVAVYGHEMYELEKLRPLLNGGKMTIDEFIACTCAGNPGNFHDEAWAHSNSLVRRMRGGQTK